VREIPFMMKRKAYVTGFALSFPIGLYFGKVLGPIMIANLSKETIVLIGFAISSPIAAILGIKLANKILNLSSKNSRFADGINKK
jgi:hypothetical protein